MNKNILILNTGGTFNKVYNEINGKLVIDKNNKILSHIIKKAKILDITIQGLIYKDSLDITTKDRIKLKKYILKSKFNKIIIVHGTDTMEKTARYLADTIDNKKIIFTGAMKPFGIEPIEATSNLMSAFGFLNNCKKNNTYICMHGLIKKYNKITKNKQLGIFECQ
jgi:L-asparaginase